MFPIQIKRLIGKSKNENCPVDEYQSDLLNFLDNCKSKIPKLNEELITKAYLFAVNAHKNVFRKSGEPYYKHSLEVAKILINEVTLDEESIAAALLHDVIDYGENCSIKDIRNEFGSRIADIVDSLTKIQRVESQSSDTLIEIESYNRLLLTMLKDIRIILIKLADRLHNMRTLEYVSKEKQMYLARETLDIYCPIAHRLGLGNFKWELEDLSFKFLNPSEYERISEKIKATRKEREEYIKKFVTPLKNMLESDELLKKNNVKVEITGRAKHIYSIYQKMIVRGVTIDKLNDLFAVRIILDTDDHNLCFYVYGRITDIHKPVPGTFKDYIHTPKKNGYRSIHTVVIDQEGRNVEVQIRTRKMHEFAEKGLAAHFLYKGGKSKLENILQEANIKEWLDSLRLFNEISSEESQQELLENVKRNLFFDEIYVFTPAKELKKLPKDSTPLDFAYLIHSDLGNHCIGAKVNGRIVPLDYRLKNGDIVEILTSEKQEPDREWLKSVITSKAKTEIIKYFKNKEREYENIGKKIWYEKIEKEGISISDNELNEIVKSIKFNNLGNFFIELGKGVLNIDRVWDFISFKFNEYQKAKIEYINQNSNNSPRKSASETIDVELANCCYPLPGDKIIGLINDINEIIIHQKSCKNLQNILKTKDANIIEVDWHSINPKELIVDLVVTTEDKKEIANDVTNFVIAMEDALIKGIKMSHNENEQILELLVSINNIAQFQQLKEGIANIKGVKYIFRKEFSTTSHSYS